MLNKVSLYKYKVGNTAIHLMPAFIKLLWLILFIVIMSICSDIKILLALTFMCFLIGELSYIDRRIYIKTIWSLKYLLIFLILIYFFIEKDLIFGISISLKLLNIVLVSNFLIITTSPLNLMEGIKKILFPLKFIGIPINRMAFSIYLAFRFIPTIIDVGSKIMKSQTSRGVDYNESTFKGKILSLKTMLIPIFILTIRKADNLADALTVRLYDIDSNRTYVKEERIKLFDLVALLINMMILIGLIIRVW